jgi:beta-galactosidase/beta-glucuronidase
VLHICTQSRLDTIYDHVLINYTQVQVNEVEPVDIYRLTIGFRDVRIDENHILINGRPFYCRGFGMHEDSEVGDRLTISVT